MRLECSNAAEWLITLHSRYNSSKITLNESTEAFTAIYNPIPNRSMLVGRFDRETRLGYVICRRRHDIVPETEKRGRFSH